MCWDRAVRYTTTVIFTSVVLDFVCCQNYKIVKPQLFRCWIVLPSLGKKGGSGQKAYLLGPSVELYSDLESPMSSRVQISSFPPFLPEDGWRIELSKSSSFII
jgi:hypothetical protein